MSRHADVSIKNNCSKNLLHKQIWRIQFGVSLINFTSKYLPQNLKKLRLEDLSERCRSSEKSSATFGIDTISAEQIFNDLKTSGHFWIQAKEKTSIVT